MNKLILSLFGVFCSSALLWAQPPAADSARPPVFTGAHTAWHEGVDRYDYIMEEQTLETAPYERPDADMAPGGEGFGVKDPPSGKRRCIVVVPRKPAPGNPWYWQACYWDHQPQAEVGLLRRVCYIAFITPDAGR